MKKVLVALLALAMVFTFASCNNNGKAPYEDWSGVGVKIAKHDASDGFEPSGEFNEGNVNQIEEASYSEGVITVKADVNAMKAYLSSDSGQNDQTYKWFALAISVGKDLVDDETLKIQGTASLADARSDISKYTDNEGNNLAADEFVLWCKAEKQGTLTLEREGAEKLTITINVEDTGSTGSEA